MWLRKKTFMSCGFMTLMRQTEVFWDTTPFPSLIGSKRVAQKLNSSNTYVEERGCQ
jgi:hypothetical protein